MDARNFRSEDQQKLEDLKARFSAFLEVPKPGKHTFKIGYLKPSDVPGQVTEFLTREKIKVEGKRITSFKSFTRLFTEKTQPPQAPTPADFTSQAEQAYPSVPLDNLNEIERLRGVWISRKLKDAEAIHVDELERYERREWKRQEILEGFEKTKAGYVAFLIDRYPLIGAFMGLQIPVYIDERSRQRHTYIVGKSGSGKSELLKYLAHAYVSGRAPESAVIVIDPHGDLAEDVARLKCFAGNAQEKLVYFDPVLDEDSYPVINPFFASEIDGLESETARKRQIAKYAKELVGALGTIISQDDGASFTYNMRMLLRNCICTLLQHPNLVPSLEDLDHLVSVDPSKEGPGRHWLEKGAASLYESHAEWFKTKFPTDHYGPTKNGISAKLQSLLGEEFFKQCVCGKSTIDLEEAINGRKVIIFSLAQGAIEEECSSAIGALILSLVAAIGFARQRIPEEERIPVHIFVDECQNFLSGRVKKVLTEARKYKVYLTLAQQVIGQDMDMNLEEIVLGNTDVKITGSAGNKSFNKFARETGIEVEDLHRLGKWQFFLSAGDNLRLPIRTYDHLVGRGASMTEEEWAEARVRQINSYYRPLSLGGGPDPLSEANADSADQGSKGSRLEWDEL